MKTLTIDRKFWDVSQNKIKDEGSLLYDPKNKLKCCLGFHIKRFTNLSVKDIANTYYPYTLCVNFPEIKEIEEIKWLINNTISVLGDTFHCLTNSNDASQLIDINDDSSLSAKQREKKIKEVFAKHDIKVKFTGSYRKYKV